MRYATQARVLSNQSIGSGWQVLWLEDAAIAQQAQPGQFVTVRCGTGIDPLLARILSIALVRQGTFALLFSAGGRGTAWLLQRQPGDAVPIIGPLGQGFTVDTRGGKTLVVAEGWGFGSALALAQRSLQLGNTVTLLYLSANPIPAPLLSLVPEGVEVMTAAAEGAPGRRGMAMDILADYTRKCDQVFLSASTGLYRRIASYGLTRSLSTPMQALAEIPMACGLGLCYTCAVKTQEGMKLACTDGPVFDLRLLVTSP